MWSNTNIATERGSAVWRCIQKVLSIVDLGNLPTMTTVMAPAVVREAKEIVHQPAAKAISWLSRHGFLRVEMLIALLASVLSIACYIWYASQGLTLAYGDAISHMSIAHRVFASRTPGLAQLGSVWPPLNHILMLPFVWNDTLYRSGLAGSLPSMAAYVAAAVYMYRTGALLFGSWRNGIVAAGVLMLNPSILYMQATPMSEMDLICFAVIAVFYACRWGRTQQAPDLTKCAAAVAAGTLIRYDGWALALALLAIVAAIAWRKRDRLFAEASILLYSMLAFAGCVAYLIYEQVIFGNAFDFFNGPYSAKSQENSIQSSGGLLTYHNPLLALHVYTQVMIDAAGAPFAIAAALGLAWWIWRTRRTVSSWPAYATLIPFAFNWLSLVMGITTIITPEVPNGGGSTFFNVRYGMMMLPAIALFVAALASITSSAWSKRLLMPALLALIVLYAGGTLLLGTPYALQDPLHGANKAGALQQTAESTWLIAHYKGGAILASGGAFTPMMFYTDLPTNDFITENDGAVFHDAIANPQSHAEWILVDPHNNNFDAVWSALRNRSGWRQHYVLRKTFGSVEVFELINPLPATSGSTTSQTPLSSIRFAYSAHFAVRSLNAD